MKTLLCALFILGSLSAFSQEATYTCYEVISGEMESETEGGAYPVMASALLESLEITVEQGEILTAKLLDSWDFSEYSSDPLWNTDFSWDMKVEKKRLDISPLTLEEYHALPLPKVKGATAQHHVPVETRLSWGDEAENKGVFMTVDLVTNTFGTFLNVKHLSVSLPRNFYTQSEQLLPCKRIK